MITYNSNDLLSFDFLHDNPGNTEFFKKNKVYNLNDLTKFKIDNNIFINKYNKNIEQYVKNIMLSNFQHVNHEVIDQYLNINNISFEYKNNYTLILDNMQCNIKNILNIKMLLNNPIINVYIPFILCCENINVNSIDNNDNNNEKITNIINSYLNLKKHLPEINIIDIDFYEDIEQTILKKEYIEESIKIGFNYKTNKLLRFKNIKEIKNIKDSIKKLFDDLLDFSVIILENNILFYNTIFLEIINDIQILKETNYFNNENNKIKFNRVKALIISMKEMRDWYYVKEIVNIFNNNIISDNVIYCTADSINLFRAILYNISTINTHNSNIKYFALYNDIINKEGKKEKFIIYEQISPSYYYSEHNNEQLKIKNELFAHINNSNTNIITKNIIGGDNNKIKPGIFLKYNENKKNLINIKNYCIISNIMNYKKIRLELFICINKLFFCLHDLYLDAEIIYEEIIKNKLSIEHINNISNFIFYNNMLINFTNNYEITILKCLDYKPNKNNLSKIENDYFIYKDLKNSNSKSEFDFYMEIYLDDLDNFKFRIMNVYDDIFNKLKCNKFYSDSNYKLTPNEEFYSLVFGYIINITCELAHREYIGYVLKIILNTHNYNLIRNSFAIYFDEHMDYPDYIKGILRFVTTFDENSFEYVDRYVKNTSSYLEYDSMPIEDFEIKDIESKYKFIMELINEKLEEIKKDEFVIDNIEYS